MSAHLPLQIYQHVIDNDVRMMTAPGVHRRGQIIRFDAFHAWVKWTAIGKKFNESRIDRSKIYPNDRVRRTGYSLI